MAINMEYLSHFIVAAEYHNFTLAAERLFMSQSTLSRQIKDLEEECGVPLFIRNGRTVDLTLAGRALYDAGRPLLAHLEQVTDLVSRSGTYMGKRIIIYSIPGFFDELTEAYRRIRASGIQAEIVMNSMQQQDPLALLELDAVDFIVTYSPFLKADPQYVRIPFAEESFCVACGPTHPFAHRESVTLDECLRETVFFGKDFPMALRQGASSIASGDLPEGKVSMNLESAYAPIVLGEGTVILPASACRDYASDLCYIPISDPELVHQVILVYRSNNTLSPAARTYADIVAQIGRERLQSTAL